MSGVGTFIIGRPRPYQDNDAPGLHRQLRRAEDGDVVRAARTRKGNPARALARETVLPEARAVHGVVKARWKSIYRDVASGIAAVTSNSMCTVEPSCQPRTFE